MPRETETVKLLRTLQGLCKPSSGEVCELAGIAKLNKIYLAYLRGVRGVLRDELVREETRYRWFTGNAVEIVGVLESGGNLRPLQV
jgi:ABC-type transport system involved in cytochrome c biogenesis ATPase subunit